MGQYITTRLVLNGTDVISNAVQPLFSSGFFKPVAVGGIEAHGERGDWFLAGFALEDFVDRFSRGYRIASVETAAAPGSEHGAYLRSLVEWAPAAQSTSSTLSPFETRDPSGVASTISAHLDTSFVATLERWIIKHQAGVLYVYGTLELELSDIRPRRISAFREIETLADRTEIAGSPLLVVRAAVQAGTTEVTFHTDSLIWLRQGEAFGGRIGVREADLNLANLASLAQLVGGRHLVDREIRTEGSAFRKEAARIEAEFERVLG
jgi:hypothetical protein